MNYRLLTVLLVLIGCDRSVAPALAPQGTTASSTARAVSDTTPVAAALGLGATVTPDQMAALEAKAKESGTFWGETCGVTTLPDGTTYGSYTNIYAVAVPGYEKPQPLSFGHIQHAANPIVFAYGAGFQYRLQDGVFVLRSDSAGR